MAEQRHVYRVGTSTVVAIPLRVRAHLAIKRGDAVYWHVVRGAEVVLSPRAERIGGRPEGLTLARQLDAALKEVARLRDRDQARDRTLFAEGYVAGQAATQQRYEHSGSPAYARALARRTRLGATVSRSARRKDARDAARRATRVPTPVLSPPSEASDEGAAASGAQRVP
jgi:antitoxin component of MazEF toxin-antitoxin module